MSLSTYLDHDSFCYFIAYFHVKLLQVINFYIVFLILIFSFQIGQLGRAQRAFKQPDRQYGLEKITQKIFEQSLNRQRKIPGFGNKTKRQCRCYIAGKYSLSLSLCFFSVSLFYYKCFFYLSPFERINHDNLILTFMKIINSLC